MLISLQRNEFTSVLANMFTKWVNEEHIYSLPPSPRLPAILNGGMDAAVVVNSSGCCSSSQSDGRRYSGEGGHRSGSSSCCGSLRPARRLQCRGVTRWFPYSCHYCCQRPWSSVWTAASFWQQQLCNSTVRPCLQTIRSLPEIIESFLHWRDKQFVLIWLHMLVHICWYSKYSTTSN